MKSIFIIFALCLSLLLGAGTASSAPLNLTTFTADPFGVSVNYGTRTVTFTEDMVYSAIYFYNDTFLVDPFAATLSFNYSLNLGTHDDDYLVGVIDFTNYFFERGVSQTGFFQYDFSPFSGQTISLAFGLESNDLLAGSSATISNLDMTVIPVPGTLILLASGLAGLLGIGRKRRFFI
jgi:hypothetical protein